MQSSLCQDQECDNFGRYWRSCGHRPPEGKKTYRIPQVSQKQQKNNADFAKVKNEHLRRNPFCKICGQPAMDVHHSKGKTGFLLVNGVKLLLLTAKEFFVSLCRNCHRKAEDNPTWAKEQGISSSRLNKT